MKSASSMSDKSAEKQGHFIEIALTLSTAKAGRMSTSLAVASTVKVKTLSLMPKFAQPRLQLKKRASLSG